MDGKFQRGLKRKNTVEQTNELTQYTIDPKLVERYGTSIANYMGRDYNNQLKSRIETLRKEFEVIDKDKNSFLSLEELTDFFKNSRPNVLYYNII